MSCHHFVAIYGTYFWL